jgi:hypothetical protein
MAPCGQRQAHVTGGKAEAILHILCSAAGSAIVGEIAVGDFRRLRQELQSVFLRMPTENM